MSKQLFNEKYALYKGDIPRSVSKKQENGTPSLVLKLITISAITLLAILILQLIYGFAG